MRKTFVPLLLALAAVGHAENLNQVATQHAREFRAALEAKKATWYEKYATKDYYETDVHGGRSDRAKALATMKQMMTMTRGLKLDLKVVKVVPKGTGMVVTMDGRLSGQLISPDKKAHPLTSVLRYEETWTKDGGRWWVHSQKTLAQKDTIDGKAIG